MAKKIQIYDTTLRDGTQGEGISFSVQDKLTITKELDKFGVDYIEGGWPGSNPKDVEFFKEAKKLKLSHAKIAAFGSTRHAKNTPAQDPNLVKLAQAKTSVITIFGKAWDLHVKDALRVPLETNLKMIESSIKYLCKKTDEVFFDAEHYFDGYKDNPEYALKALEAALNGGAAGLVLCDTNGGSLPDFIYEATKKVCTTFKGARVGIHCHNDSGLATANSLASVQAGAMQVQGTINGLGERCGNADLIEIIPSLEIKLKKKTLGSKKLKSITDFSRYIYEIANIIPPESQPYVGRSAFAHKAGIHVSAIARNEKTYEHISPVLVGNERRILISELSGRSNLKALKNKELEKNPDLMKKVLEKVMYYENLGYAFEAAGASFNLIIWEIAKTRKFPFTLESYRVMSNVQHIEKDEKKESEATVKVKVGKELYHTVSEGDHGPVDALFNALKKALIKDFPIVEKLRLIDYKVHIVNAQAATGAKVRVTIQSTGFNHTWGTVGVSENIIEASCHALIDSIEYLLQNNFGSKKKK